MHQYLSNQTILNPAGPVVDILHRFIASLFCVVACYNAAKRLFISISIASYKKKPLIIVSFRRSVENAKLPFRLIKHAVRLVLRFLVFAFTSVCFFLIPLHSATNTISSSSSLRRNIVGFFVFFNVCD